MLQFILDCYQLNEKSIIISDNRSSKILLSSIRQQSSDKWLLQKKDHRLDNEYEVVLHYYRSMAWFNEFEVKQCSYYKLLNKMISYVMSAVQRVLCIQLLFFCLCSQLCIINDFFYVISTYYILDCVYTQLLLLLCFCSNFFFYFRRRSFLFENIWKGFLAHDIVNW